MWGRFLQQAIGEIPFVIPFAKSFSAASYWGCPSSGIFFVPLLGKDHPQGFLLQQASGEMPFVGSFFATSYWMLLGKSHLWGLFLQQAIGMSQFWAFFCSGLPASLQGFLLEQALGEFPFVGSFFAVIYLGKSHL